MRKITVSQALQFAEENFPYAPERLAELLQIEVRRTPLNCDGWCLQVRGHSIIRINSNVVRARQRFTLAHELGHLILGIPSVVGESMFESQGQSSDEEKLVNTFAGDILLPLKFAQEQIPDIPVTASVLRRLARQAKVSELFVARRLVTLASEIGLKHALVVFYQNDVYKWQWSDTAMIPPALANTLLQGCLESDPAPARFDREEDENIEVAFVLDNPHFGTKTIFVQVLDREAGQRQSVEELERELDEFVFAGREHLRQSVAGCFGVMKRQVRELFLDEAVQLFNKRYLKDRCHWDEEFRNLFLSERGQIYIKLRLRDWVRS